MKLLSDIYNLNQTVGVLYEFAEFHSLIVGLPRARPVLLLLPHSRRMKERPLLVNSSYPHYESERRKRL